MRSQKPPSPLVDGRVPVLDGQELTLDEQDAVTLTSREGVPVPSDRLSDVVWVDPSASEDDEGWWAAAGLAAPGGGLFESPAVGSVSVGGEVFSSDDVAAMLAGVADSFRPASADMSPSSFHRMLQRFVEQAGEDPADAAEAGGDTLDDDDLGWGIWKAALAVIDHDLSTEDTTVYEAEVYRGEPESPAVFSYWLRRKDGRVVGAGWVSPPPQLGAGAVAFASDEVDDLLLAGLF